MAVPISDPTGRNTLASPTPDASQAEHLIERIESLEHRLQERRPAAGEPSAWWSTLAPILTPVVLLVLGYWLTDSINLALKKQELQADTVSAMQKLLSQMNKQDLTGAEAESVAIALAAYGHFAVTPLIHELSSPTPERSLAAQRALGLLSLSRPPELCRQLTRLLQNRTQLFSWQTHRKTLRLLGQVNCRESLPVLEEYARAVENAKTDSGLAEFQKWFEPKFPPTRESVKLIEKDIEQAHQWLTLQNTVDRLETR